MTKIKKKDTGNGPFKNYFALYEKGVGHLLVLWTGIGHRCKMGHRRRCKKILDVDEDKKTKAAAAGTGAYNLLRGMRKMSLLIQF